MAEMTTYVLSYPKTYPAEPTSVYRCPINCTECKSAMEYYKSLNSLPEQLTEDIKLIKNGVDDETVLLPTSRPLSFYNRQYPSSPKNNETRKTIEIPIINPVPTRVPVASRWTSQNYDDKSQLPVMTESHLEEPPMIELPITKAEIPVASVFKRGDKFEFFLGTQKVDYDVFFDAFN